MQRLARVFFEVGAGQVHYLLAILRMDAEASALHDRQFVLADLVSLEKVGIEIILARENRTAADVRSHPDSEAGRTETRPPVPYRQRTRQGTNPNTRLRVR